MQLNRRESQLRHLLLDVSKYINKSRVTEQPLVIRWAGGWVRDKVLGIETHDIDVAINLMTGVDFAQRMCAYCSTEEAIRKYSIKSDDIGNLHNVARNPDKSKHLETAMLRIFGLDLDLVNLRKEQYAETSRNPVVEFGTPEEDALRRDATINALFYNLHTNEIEDFTGGLQDLAGKVVRTPLNPLETFKDDPLRVLRLVRFASRLDFTIHDDTRNVMANEQVLKALQVKISRERVGNELEKMLKGRRPSSALELVDKLHLYHAIFTCSNWELFTKPDTSRWHVAYECLNDLLQDTNPGSIGQFLVRSEDAAYVAWNLAALSPWMRINDPPEEYHGGLRKANKLPPVSIAAREGFKAPNKLTITITASHRHRKEIMEMKMATSSNESVTIARDTLGMAIRAWDSHGGQWTLQVLSALMVDALENLHTWPKAGDTARDEFLSGWQIFINKICEMDVYDASAVKLLLDGRTLARALGVPPGKWTGKALDVCMEWQFRNPHEVNPNGAIEEIKRCRDELGIPRPDN
ncbi:CCA tRNA nucleotidyltransferase, mitochondrial [Conoideocrella luteorostrata]|uniref:CCA tRNA nucleotidyltransferase, mitochondrial n=1 Tax=Conoideocrella luteorostrata TaxID=1105319 RepID=A0AAJ0CKU0_9HYPO|nr:CCA tRNA nucleotidyltransferase, mitochondrial [Conoideocrella luteorostrata]